MYIFEEKVSPYDDTDKYLCDLLQGSNKSPIKHQREPVPINYGRWDIHEGQAYLNALKAAQRSDGRVEIICFLREAVPSRQEAQIRAHHHKMLKRHGDIESILRTYDHPFNDALLRIAERLGRCE